MSAVESLLTCCLFPTSKRIHAGAAACNKKEQETIPAEGSTAADNEWLQFYELCELCLSYDDHTQK